jgi:hypothetical protein
LNPSKEPMGAKERRKAERRERQSSERERREDRRRGTAAVAAVPVLPGGDHRAAASLADPRIPNFPELEILPTA